MRKPDAKGCFCRLRYLAANMNVTLQHFRLTPIVRAPNFTNSSVRLISKEQAASKLAACSWIASFAKRRALRLRPTTTEQRTRRTDQPRSQQHQRTRFRNVCQIRAEIETRGIKPGSLVARLLNDERKCIRRHQVHSRNRDRVHGQAIRNAICAVKIAAQGAFRPGKGVRRHSIQQHIGGVVRQNRESSEVDTGRCAEGGGVDVVAACRINSPGTRSCRGTDPRRAWKRSMPNVRWIKGKGAVGPTWERRGER